MATTCFGPPPLPPAQSASKKSKVIVTIESQPSNKTSKNNSKKKIMNVLPQMSSTYRSFRDPVEEDEIIVIASEDMLETKPIQEKKHKHKNGSSSKYNTNSLTRPLSASKMTLARSHSEGNLAVAAVGTAGVQEEHNMSLPPIGASALNKCLRVLSGSWKNLFQCKYLPFTE